MITTSTDFFQVRFVKGYFWILCPITVRRYGLCRKYLPLPEKPYVVYFIHILKTRSKPCGMGNYLMLCAGHHYHLISLNQLNLLQWPGLHIFRSIYSTRLHAHSCLVLLKIVLLKELVCELISWIRSFSLAH